jgi:ABC-type multidrug transport system permease subunit
MPGGFAAALAKDLRLLRRDRVGLAFLTIAPIVVITVAGLSLSTLYGAAPRGGTAPVLPLVDEDGGWVGRAVRDRLATEPTVHLREVRTADAARALVVHKAAGAALVLPAGTSDAVRAGREATLVLFTDPVRTVDVATVRALVQELRHGVEAAALGRAQDELDAARARALDARADLERGVADLRARLDETADRAERARSEAARRAQVAERQLAGAVAEREAGVRARLAATLASLRGFLDELAAARTAFERWLTDARRSAGRFADRLPPPPTPPPVPRPLEELAHEDAETIARRLVDGGPAAPAPPRIELPTLPPLPTLELPPLPDPPAARLPGPLAITETSVTGAPSRFNTFDQNVPGFGVTFLLLGVLLGLSLGLIDERDWGTLERVRTTPMPLATLLAAKLSARVLVGLAQMALLFAVGRAAFGVSLGPQPWALALPTAGIVFSGTAFGLVVAAVTRSREAVMPVGAIAVLTMTAVGGCWWPIDLEPEWMRRVALAFPTTWAMEAYNDLMIRRRTASAALPATAVLFLYGAVFLGLGVLAFRRRLARGGG